MLFSKKDLRKLIIPLLIEQILVMAVGMIDTMMISVISEEAVSSVSLVDTINVLIINIFTALATGGAVVAGHYLGEEKKQEAKEAGWQLILFGIVTSFIMTVFFVLGHDWILRVAFGKVEPIVYEGAKSYLMITAISIVPLAIYNGGAAIFRAIGNSKITMLISLLMNVINIIGNYILINIVKIGVSGAAIATTVSRIVAAIVILCLLFNEKYDINFRGVVTWKFQKVNIKKILYVGIPNAVENSFFQLGKIMVLSIVSTLGTYAIAANAVAGTLAMFNVLPGMAINFAILSVTAFCIGAGEIEQAKYYTKKLVSLVHLFTLVMTVIIILFGRQILTFYHLSQTSADLTMEVITFHGIMAVFFWAPSFSIPNTLRSGGDAVFPLIIGTISMWFFRIATAYVLCMKMDVGLMGVWIAMIIDWIFRGICFMIRYCRGNWLKIGEQM